MRGRLERGISVDQGHYIDRVEEIVLSAKRKENTREELFQDERKRGD